MVGVDLSQKRIGKMPLQIRPLNESRANFAGQVDGLDIRQPLAESDRVTIENAMNTFGVLVFPDQQINDEQQYAFSCNFGSMERATGDITAQSERRLSMELNDISNLNKNGQILDRHDRTRLFGLGNMLWHSDSSFKSTPAKYSLLSARDVPDRGGNTEFADMRLAWDSLDPALKRECSDLVCEHSQIYSRGKLGFTDFTDDERLKWQPVLQKLVRRHPGSQRLSLYLSSHIGTIVDWPVPEARLFILDLEEHATQPQFVYAHQWRQWDLVMWDNRVLMHRARRYDHTVRRDLRRTTVAGDASTMQDL